MLVLALVGTVAALLLLFTILGRGGRSKVEPISREALGRLEGPLLLVVDDSVTIQKVVELTFFDADLTAVGVSDPATALDFLEQKEFAAALVDIHLPLEEGYELCEQMKRRRPELPVILLVGAFEAFDRARFERSGAADVIKKPFDTKDLRSIVEDFLAE